MNRKKYHLPLGRPGRRHSYAPKATVHPTMRDLGWAAGFLEGEGSFDLNTRRRQPGVWRTPQVRAAQVQREPLEKLVRLFGGKIYLQKHPSPRARQQHRWSIASDRARGVMMTLYAMMSLQRKQQIRFALLSQST